MRKSLRLGLPILAAVAGTVAVLSPALVSKDAGALSWSALLDSRVLYERFVGWAAWLALPTSCVLLAATWTRRGTSSLWLLGPAAILGAWTLLAMAGLAGFALSRALEPGPAPVRLGLGAWLDAAAALCVLGASVPLLPWPRTAMSRVACGLTAAALVTQPILPVARWFGRYLDPMTVAATAAGAAHTLAAFQSALRWILGAAMVALAVSGHPALLRRTGSMALIAAGALLLAALATSCLVIQAAARLGTQPLAYSTPVLLAAALACLAAQLLRLFLHDSARRAGEPDPR